MALTGPEIDWLKAQSGYTDEELSTFEQVMGGPKFIAMLQKLQKNLGDAEAAKTAAETKLRENEDNYVNKVVPEIRQVTKDALKARGEAARLQAQLEQAREYGVVPDEEGGDKGGDKGKGGTQDPPRAPGSPDPQVVTRDDFGRFSQSQSNVIVTLNDLNAEHFRLFGEPLGGTQELVDEVNRQRTLGNKNFSLKNAWETKHNVAAKRQEIAQKAERAKVDTAVQAALKAEREKNGGNPNLRTGVVSRFSSYKPSQAGQEPWKLPRSVGERNRPWREKAVARVREFIAA